MSRAFARKGRLSLLVRGRGTHSLLRYICSFKGPLLVRNATRHILIPGVILLLQFNPYIGESHFGFGMSMLDNPLFH